MANNQVVVNYGNKSASLAVDANETVAGLKTSLVQNNDFEITEQDRLILLVKGTDRRLDDSLLLSSCGLGVEDLQLELVSMLEVRLVKVGREDIITEIQHNATVADLKAKIFEQCKMPVNTQYVRHSGVTLQDDTSLAVLRVHGSHHVELQLEIRLTLTLEVYTGAIIQLELSDSEHVDRLYAEVNRQARVPYQRQEIVYDGRVLEMGLKIDAYNIPDQTTLLVNLRDYEVMVFVKTLTGQTIMLTVSPRDTVAQVKAKIQQQEGFPIKNQRLIFVGEQLHDNHRFLDYPIEHESAVHLVIREGNTFEIYVQTPTAGTRVFEVDPKGPVEQLKTKLRDRDGIPCDLQQLFYRDRLLDSNRSIEENGINSGSTLRLSIDRSRSTQISISFQQETFPLWVSRYNTILHVKRMIAEKKNISPDFQLFFARNVLENDRTLNDYTIETNHMLHVHLARLQFTVTVQGDENGPVQCEELANQTVFDVKSFLFNKLNAPVKEQQLFLEGSELENMSKLSDCGISDGCNLDLVLSQPLHPREAAKNPKGAVLFVKTLTGKTVMVDITPTDTVLSLKEQILAKEGVEVGHQALVCGGKILDNDTTVSESGLQNQSVLHLVLRVPSQSPVTVTVECGEQSLEVPLADGATVEWLKEEIASRTGIQATRLTLLSGEVMLYETEPIANYDIKEGTVIQVVQDN